MKRHFKHALQLLLALIIGSTAFAVQGQKLEGTLRLLVGYSPGGASDRAARLVGDALQKRYGLTVIVENRTGAGGRLAAQQLKLATVADNVLMLGNPAVITVAPLVFKDVGYDPEGDFVPVSQVTSYEFGVAIGPQVPASTLSDLLAWLAANPQKAFFGVPATGSLPHFFALMIGERAGLKADVVGYKGSAPLATDLIGGQIPVAVDTLDSLMPLHDGGKLKVLATSGRSRSLLAKDVPTFSEAGVDLVASGWNTFFAPRSMPADKVRDYAIAIQSVMADPALRKQFVASSMDPVSASQEQTIGMLKAYRAQWEPVIKRSGFQE